MEAKQVIVVRKDLNMRKGKIAAQVAHASLGAVLKDTWEEKVLHIKNITLSIPEHSPICAWLEGPFTKICVSVDSEAELLELVEKAKEQKILHCLITDAGKTEFKGVPTITCAAFGPAWCEDLDKLTGHLKLL
jgi:PTH2 family peptidyl-tRNA hydrolase